MADSHLVSGLVSKRAELAQEAEGYRRELQRLAETIGHLDATIRLFAPDCALDDGPPRQRRPRLQRFAGGECQRLVLETLRDAAGPLSDRAVVAAVAARKGLSDDPRELEKTTLAVLRRLAQKRAARVLVLPGGERGWERA